ncbi:acetolactate synthase small subunit [Roseivirga misakiensis]|uniref:Acetolactate synthase small subunit n=1 Tax=Roseivirga misakiensis TaxID=1563681 RepID=A0A1E5SZE7_9BACT|nr:acetolactate synthase small subunit [Roseivirga misakiensis]OEK04489.1 acetolactate synthase small subunit [Roseivirga misakiensis]
MIQSFTISIFSENSIGLLHRITSIFTKRHLSIESLNTSESEQESVFRFTVVVKAEEELVQKIVKQIEKQVEVIQAVYHLDEETVFQEIALYKLSTEKASENNLVERLIRDSHARILSMEPEYMIIEKTGHKEETQELLEFLRPLGLKEFVRSGRVSVIRPKIELQKER